MPEITVKDLLKLESMKEFKVIAGEKGLDNVIDYVEILDYEFTKGASMDRKSVFDGRSIVLTSLLFAKDEPELILDAVKRLKAFNVSAMAYKTTFFGRLPEEVLEYADRESFAILQFGGDEFFERVIFDILSAVNEEGRDGEKMRLLQRLIEEELDETQTRDVAYSINPGFKRYACAVGIKPLSNDISGRAAGREPARRLAEKTSMIKYRDIFILILTQDSYSCSRFYALLEDMYAIYGLTGRDFIAGKSSIGPVSRLDYLVKEAIEAVIVADINNERMIEFANTGIYRIIAAQQKNKEADKYVKEVIKTVCELDREGEKCFFDTAAAYVKAGGDFEKAAEIAFCHKNTVRYRIKRIQEALNSDAGDKEFYLELAYAVKSYLYKEKSGYL